MSSVNSSETTKQEPEKQEQDCVLGIISGELLHSIGYDVMLMKRAFAPHTGFTLIVIGEPFGELPKLNDVQYKVVSKRRFLFFPPRVTQCLSIVVFDELWALGRLVKKIPKDMRVIVQIERSLQEQFETLSSRQKKLTHKALARATHILAPTTAIAKEIKALEENACVDMVSPPLFVDWIVNDTHTLRESFPQFTIIMLVASDFIETKGLFSLLGVLPALVERYPKLGVLVVGNGPGLEAIKSRIAELNLQTHVFTLGSREDTQLMLAQADIVCLYQTHVAPTRAQLRAIAASTPLIVSQDGLAVGVLPATLVHIVPKNNPEALGRMVAEVITNTDNRLQDRKQLRELANKAALTQQNYLSRITSHIAAGPDKSV